MIKTKLTSLGLSVLTALPALAQTTPAPTTPGTAASGAASSATGIGNYWWLILVAIVAAAAIWYFMRGRSKPMR